MKGYFAIGIYQTKTIENVGTLWRTAQNFGASFIFTIGARYRQQASDTTKVQRHIPLFMFTDFDCFRKHRPINTILIGIEQTAKSKPLKQFVHPTQAIYLLGAEDSGLSEDILLYCNTIVSVSTPSCLNVAVAGSIVMYDRSIKM